MWCGASGDRQAGVTYLVVLFLVAVVGMGLAAVGTYWQTELQRNRERELLFIGEQFGVALKRFYDASPGKKEFPRRLEELLDDRRHLTVHRHLRQIFPDPMTGQRDWVLVLIDGKITAVHSRSKHTPIMKNGFPPAWAESFRSAKTLSDWLFTPLAPRPSHVTAYRDPPESQAADPLRQDATPGQGASATEPSGTRRLPASLLERMRR